MNKAHGNINNKIDIIKNKEKIQVLKNFKSKDWYYRFHREKNFYNYCKINRIKKIPILLFSNSKNKSLKINYIENQKKNLHDKIYLENTMYFIKQLNTNFLDQNYKYFAKENLTQKSLYSRLNNRIKKLESSISQTKYKFYNKFIEQIKFEKIKYGKSILNPSDVGKHNTLVFRNNLKFIDFEYAGKDKILKFTVDYVMHPSNQFNFKKYEVYSNYLLKNLDPSYGKINKSLFTYFAIWWSMRLQNNISKKEIDFKIKNNLIERNNIKTYVSKRKKLIEKYEFIANYFKN